MKDLPDATFPGILRELLGLDFPLVVNTEVSIPDQAERLKLFKGRLRRMTAAQRDSKGGFKVNVDARVAEGQLMQTLQDLISSSLKSAQVSVVVAVRTSTPIQSRRDLEEQERVLADRRQRALHAIMRMNGARGLPEDLAKRRLYINGLPGMTEENKREHDCFTLHAADLLMVESPWKGTPNSPLILLETPYRQLVPFSPFDPGLSDANVLITAKSGGGKTFMAQMFLTMMARLNPLISILERGNSYRPLVELMGGRCIDVDLEGAETLNAWDLPRGSTMPSNDKLAFLKNLTRHMIGMNSPAADTAILDNLLTDAIVSHVSAVPNQGGQADPDVQRSAAGTGDMAGRIGGGADSGRGAARRGEAAGMDRGEGVRPAIRPAHDHPHRRKLALLQCGGPDLRPEAGKLDEHDHRERDVGARVGTKRPAEYHGPRRVLVAAGLGGVGAAGGAAVPNRPKARGEHLGHQPGAGRLRRNRDPTAAARPRHRQERLDQDHWAAAGRPEAARHISAS